MSTFAYSPLLFSWYILFYLLTFSLYVFASEVQTTDGFCFIVQLSSLYLLVGKLRPFRLRIINEIYVLIAVFKPWLF
jgi:hypothetical protein